ncbi:MAG: hypothetical protein IMY73_01650 [Bacteroidetes bacterium]|nr:hypothetical protein [Bacteroidota bacterium]
MKNRIVFFILVSVGLSYLSYRYGVKKSFSENHYCTDTVTIVKTDTIKQLDVRYTTKYLDRVVVDTLRSVDSVYVRVEVPISRYIFEDSLYRAEVSGYGVELNSIELYNSKTVESRIFIKKRSPFSLSLSAGYGISDKGLSPYLGVGVSYNLLNF